MKVPEGILQLYTDAQIDSDMDTGTYVGGTDHYGVDRFLEAIAVMAGWTLPPRMSPEDRVQYLIDNGREDEIEYLMGD